MSHTVKWDALKEKAHDAIAAIEHRPGGLGASTDFLAILPALKEGKHPREILAAWYKEAHRIIDAWDVRRAPALVAAFPHIVPAKYKNAQCTTDCDGPGGVWVVHFGAAREE